jgi:hypothetical protein
MEVPTEKAEDLLYEITSAPGPLLHLRDGRILDAAVVAEGAVLPHRLSATEVANNWLDLEPDLAVLVPVAEGDGGLFLENGTPLPLRRTRTRAAGPSGSDVTTHRIEGPDGWLTGLAAGDLVHVRVGSGIVSVVRAGEPGPTSPTREAVAGCESAFDAHAPGEPADGTPEDLAALQAAGLVDGWWAPQGERCPFGELVRASTLELSGDQAGRPGAWERLQDLRDLLGPIARHRLLTETGGKTLIEAMKAWRERTSDGGFDPPPTLGRALDDDLELADALVAELRRAAFNQVSTVEEASELVAHYLDAAAVPSGRRGAGLVGLRARAALARGDLALAEDLATQATRLDAHHPTAVEIQAELTANRGDLRGAVSLLRRVRSPDDREFGLLSAHLARMNPDVGRNEPCPCGSGRKYKQCHLGRNELPGDAAVAWFLDQVRTYVVELAPPRMLADLAESVPLPSGQPDDPDDPSAAEDVAMVVAQDIAVFEMGWLDRFASARQPILSEEQRSWAAGWPDSQRPGLYRVDRAGSGLTLKNIETDETFDVGTSLATEAIPDGTVAWARLLPARGRWWTGGLCIGLRDEHHVELVRSALALDDPIARVEALLGMPPDTTPSNTDGSPAMVCQTGISHSLDRDALVAVLDAACRRGGNELADRRQWHLTLASGASARVTVPGLDVELTETIAGADPETIAGAQSILRTVMLFTDSLADHRAATDQVIGLLTDAGGAPEIVHRQAIPNGRWEALIDERELVDLVDRTLEDDDEDEDWEADDDLP